MGKKKRKRKGGSPAEEPALSKKKGSMNKWILIGIAAVVVIGGAYLLTHPGRVKEAALPKPESMSGIVEETEVPYNFRETGVVLSSANFIGSVAEAYRIAEEIPEVLDQLYCYCHCAENFGHKSLLSCYVDRHAST